MVPLVLIVRKEGSPNQGRLTVKPGQLILQVYCVLHAHQAGEEGRVEQSTRVSVLVGPVQISHYNAKYIFYIRKSCPQIL